MKFDPNDDLLAEGEYDAVVEAAFNAVSKSGNEMIELEVGAFRQDGEKFIIKDWLLSMRGSQWKIRHFCKSAGLNYESGNLEVDDCTGKNVRVNVTQENSEKYGPQNRVVDYLERNGAIPATVKAVQDDDIPF